MIRETKEAQIQRYLENACRVLPVSLVDARWWARRAIKLMDAMP